VAAVARGCSADGLVLISNRLGRDLPHMAERRTSVIRRALADGSASLAAELADAALSPTVPRVVRHRVERMIATAAPEAIAALTQGIAERPDIGELLGRADLPALIVAGADDPWSPPAQAARLAERVSESVLRAVPGSGHMVPIERPRAMTSALGDFVSVLGRRPLGGPRRAEGRR
jgi:3-oxoadipate enol-lactonase